MATLIWVLIAIAVVAVIALVAMGARKRKTAMLRERFGPEYDRAVENRDDRRAAEADLRAREKQRAQFDVEPLPEATRLRFADEWRDVQERFVDQPAQAATDADNLITRVMEARGYPMKDFDAQADLVSVDHPNTVENYRFAHAVRLRSQTQQASTEDLREALLRYRSLFDELLRPEGNGAAATTGQVQPAGAGSRQRVAAGPEPQELGTSATGQTDGSAALGSDGADPADPDLDYDDQRIGRREGR
jgi:hypothetical protein